MQSKIDRYTDLVPIVEERSRFGLEDEQVRRLSVKAAFEGDRRCKRNWERFVEDLEDALEANCARNQIPRPWLRIKDAIRQVSQAGTKVMRYEEFVAFCARTYPALVGADSDEKVSALIAYLDGIGVILYRPTKGTKNEIDDLARKQKGNPLQDAVFLDTSWLADLIYRVLDKKVMEANGRFPMPM